jgi:hypothetical protein
VPPSAISEPPLAVVGGAGERSLLVAQQLGFQQRVRQRRAVHLDERAVLARAEHVHRPGDQLLAGAALAAQHHRRARRRHQVDLREHLLHRLGDADDVVDVRRHQTARGERPRPRRGAYRTGRPATGRHGPVQLHRLRDQIGDHREKADVVAEADLGDVIPHPRDGEHAERPVDGLDRHADKGDTLVVEGARRADVIGEQRMLGDVLGDERHLAREDARRHFLRQVGGAAFDRRRRQAGGGDNGERAVLAEDGDDAAAHFHVRRHEVEDGAQRWLEIDRRRQDLADLIDADQRQRRTVGALGGHRVRRARSAASGAGSAHGERRADSASDRPPAISTITPDGRTGTLIGAF